MYTFVDDITPVNIPPSAYKNAAGYGTGKYAQAPYWTDSAFEEYEHYMKIAVYPGQPDQAHIARVLDVERFDANPEDFPPFALERIHVVGKHDPTSYQSISVVSEVLREISNHPQLVNDLSWGLWVAWWWGRNYPPTLAQVRSELLNGYGVDVHPWRIRYCQWQPTPSLDNNVGYWRNNLTPGKTHA